MSEAPDKSTKFYLVNGDKKICWGYSVLGVENNRKKRISYFKQHIKWDETSIIRLNRVLKELGTYNTGRKTPVTADEIKRMIQSSKDNIERFKQYIDIIANAKIVPEKTNNIMTFDQALILLKNGQKIRRKSWTNYRFIVLSDDGKSILMYDKTSRADFSDNDILADDWEIAPKNIEELVPLWDKPKGM